jgi:hypothetical protein
MNLELLDINSHLTCLHTHQRIIQTMVASLLDHAVG